MVSRARRSPCRSASSVLRLLLFQLDSHFFQPDDIVASPRLCCSEEGWRCGEGWKWGDGARLSFHSYYELPFETTRYFELAYAMNRKSAGIDRWYLVYVNDTLERCRKMRSLYGYLSGTTSTRRWIGYVSKWNYFELVIVTNTNSAEIRDW